MPINWIVFNGPSKSGKSTAANYMRSRIWEEARKMNGPASVHVDSFAAPMKHFIAVMLSEKYADMNKEKPRPELMGRSVRELLIHMSEHYMKDRYGEDVFARTLVYRNMKNMPDYVIIDDGGFEIEKYALTKPYIIQLHREGCSFKGDSRSYWEIPKAGEGRLWKVRNNTTFEDLYETLDGIAEICVSHNR